MLPIESAWVFWGNTAPNVSLIRHMTHDEILTTIWGQLKTAHQQLNSATGAERNRLERLVDQLRIEYRHLTSTYR